MANSQGSLPSRGERIRSTLGRWIRGLLRWARLSSAAPAAPNVAKAANAAALPVVANGAPAPPAATLVMTQATRDELLGKLAEIDGLNGDAQRESIRLIRHRIQASQPHPPPAKMWRTIARIFALCASGLAYRAARHGRECVRLGMKKTCSRALPLSEKTTRRAHCCGSGPDRAKRWRSALQTSQGFYQSCRRAQTQDTKVMRVSNHITTSTTIFSAFLWTKSVAAIDIVSP